VNGYANLIAARLRKLAASGGTGMLPVSGSGDGAFFLHAGQVVHAESSRTSSRRTVGLAALGLGAVRAGEGSIDTGLIDTGSMDTGPASREPAGIDRVPASTVPDGAELVAVPSIGRVTGLLAVAELTIDAATELLSSESRYAKFRQSGVPFRPQARPIPVAALLTEVERRHHVLRQIEGTVTADTRVVRNGSPDWPRRQVSRPQWALMMGIADGRTPRGLAMELGRSVFATTVEIYRLIMLGLLAVPGNPAAGATGPAEMMPFTRAMYNGRGSDA
jgi:hypothetical protein